MPVEFHCHTLFSVDAHGTPEELVEAAAARGVSALAITEHNNIDSTKRAAAHALKCGVRYFSGVEFDAVWQGNQLHFLGLGIDPDNTDLVRLCQRHLGVYANYNEIVCQVLTQKGFPISKDELVADYPTRYPTHPSPTPNIWHLREFFLRKEGLNNRAHADETFKAVVREVRSKHAYISEEIGSFEEVCHVVHQAGGVLLLAHVAKYMPGNAQGQFDMISDLLQHGIDGFELYHPKNCAELHFEELKARATRHQCLVSGGSDSHTTPGNLGLCGAPDSMIIPLIEAIT